MTFSAHSQSWWRIRYSLGNCKNHTWCHALIATAPCVHEKARHFEREQAQVIRICALFNSLISVNYIPTKDGACLLCIRVICGSSGLPVCRQTFLAKTIFSCTLCILMQHHYNVHSVLLLQMVMLSYSRSGAHGPRCVRGVLFGVCNLSGGVIECYQRGTTGKKKYKLYRAANKTLWFTHCLRSAALRGPPHSGTSEGHSVTERVIAMIRASSWCSPLKHVLQSSGGSSTTCGELMNTIFVISFSPLPRGLLLTGVQFRML